MTALCISSAVDIYMVLYVCSPISMRTYRHKIRRSFAVSCGAGTSYQRIACTGWDPESDQVRWELRDLLWFAVEIG